MKYIDFVALHIQKQLCKMSEDSTEGIMDKFDFFPFHSQ